MALTNPNENEENRFSHRLAIKSRETFASGLSKRNLGLLLAGFLPLGAAFAANLWSKPQYQFFPVALLGVGILVRKRLLEMPAPLAKGDGPVVCGLIGTGLLFLALATVLWSPWLAAMALVTTLLGLTWLAGSWPLLREVLPVLLLVATIIPPPFALDSRLALGLRSIAVDWSSKALDTLGLVHALSGNVIELPGEKLLVEEACSGINSVLLAAACCIFYLLWKRRSGWCYLVCLPATLVFVLLGNVLRITLGTWCKVNYQVNLLSGLPHELLGLCLTVTYLGLILSLEHLLYWPALPSEIGTPVEPERERIPPPSVPQSAGCTLTEPALAKRGWILAGCFALLGVVGLGLGWKNLRLIPGGVMASQIQLKEGGRFAMPSQIGPWQRLQSGQPEFHKIETAGIVSQVWHYQNRNLVASIGLDYPFRGYHDVTDCYVSSGWSIARKTQGNPKGTAPYVVVTMNKAPLNLGELWYATIDEQGNWIDASAHERGIASRWQLPGSKVPTSYRIQLLIGGYHPLSPSEREAARELFEHARSLLAQQLLSQLGTK